MSIQLTETFAENLEKSRYDLGLTQAEMSKKLGISLPAYKRIINGENQMASLDVIVSLYNLTGRLISEFLGIDNKELSTMRKLRNLTPQSLEFIDSIIDVESELSDGKCSGNYISCIVPVGDVQDGMIWDSFNVEQVDLGNYKKKFGSMINCAIRVTSNHLHPVYHKGDILLISKSPVKDGDLGVFIDKDTNRAYLRTFRQTEPCRLEPVNNYGDIFYVNPYAENEMNRWIKFGKVICKMR